MRHRASTSIECSTRALFQRSPGLWNFASHSPVLSSTTALGRAPPMDVPSSISFSTYSASSPLPSPSAISASAAPCNLARSSVWLNLRLGAGGSLPRALDRGYGPVAEGLLEVVVVFTLIVLGQGETRQGVAAVPGLEQVAECLCLAHFGNTLDMGVAVVVLDGLDHLTGSLGGVCKPEHLRIANLVPAERAALAATWLVTNEPCPAAAGADVENKARDSVDAILSAFAVQWLRRQDLAVIGFEARHKAVSLLGRTVMELGVTRSGAADFVAHLSHTGTLLGSSRRYAKLR